MSNQLTAPRSKELVGINIDMKLYLDMSCFIRILFLTNQRNQVKVFKFKKSCRQFTRFFSVHCVKNLSQLWIHLCNIKLTYNFSILSNPLFEIRSYGAAYGLQLNYDKKNKKSRNQQINIKQYVNMS